METTDWRRVGGGRRAPVQMFHERSPSGCGATVEWLEVVNALSGYHVGVTCPRCGRATKIMATGSKRVWQQAAAIECTGRCNWVGFVNVELSTANGESAKVEQSRMRAIEREQPSVHAQGLLARKLREAKVSVNA